MAEVGISKCFKAHTHHEDYKSGQREWLDTIFVELHACSTWLIVTRLKVQDSIMTLDLPVIAILGGVHVD